MVPTRFLQRMTVGLDRIVAALARIGISEDFIRFGTVGTFGFCLDTTTIYALRTFVGLYAAGVAGYLISASANWALNRAWTFQHQSHEPHLLQWPKFLAANAIGFVINRGLFFILISISTLCRQQPVLAVLAGTMTGLGFNYFLSKRFVFR
jgi:putative flippase GtrA